MKFTVLIGGLVLGVAGFAFALHAGDSAKVASCATCGAGTQNAQACPMDKGACPMMAGAPSPAAAANATAPASQPAVDVGNTTCPVMGDAIEGAGATLTYEGKVYHFCCKNCIPAFQKDPAKYVQAMEADPAKYGIKK